MKQIEMKCSYVGELKQIETCKLGLMIRDEQFKGFLVLINKDNEVEGISADHQHWVKSAIPMICIPNEFGFFASAMI